MKAQMAKVSSGPKEQGHSGQIVQLSRFSITDQSSLGCQLIKKLDGLGHIDNRTSTNKLHPFVKKPK